MRFAMKKKMSKNATYNNSRGRAEYFKMSKAGKILFILQCSITFYESHTAGDKKILQNLNQP